MTENFMVSMDLQEIMGAVNGECMTRFENAPIQDISTDTRKISKGYLFIALEGENFDGHQFVQDAIAKGALAVIVSKPVHLAQDLPVIRVENTLQALWRIAALYRSKFSKPVVAVTGSVGKTSTKDMIATILSAKYHVHKSHANFNNHIGLPLTVLGWEEDHDLMIVEMGMRGFGEIRTLTQIARPSIAVITNIGISHIERLGSQENILKAKLEIVEGLRDEGVLILNANDPFLSKVDRSFAKKMIFVGIDTDADYSAYDIVDHGEEGVSFKLKLDGKEYSLHIPAVGIHNVHNALCGIACAVELGLRPEEILTGVRLYQPEKMRMDILEKDDIKFINDSYNASPDSMKAALQALRSISGDKRAIAILGSMFELGEMAAVAHQEVGKVCRDLEINFTAIMGENADDMARGIGDSSKYRVFNTHEEIVAFMKAYLRKGDVVLIKGSRGMQMERILELWDK